MLTKLAALFITLILCIAIGVVVLATMLIAMNGYSESDATWGLGVFILLALLVSGIASIAAFFLTGILTNKQYKPAISLLLSVLLLTILGGVLKTISAFIGIGVAEFVRQNY